MEQVLSFFSLHGAAIASFCLPLLVAFVKSELMALNSKPANGIAHYFVLCNRAMTALQAANLPPEAKAALDQVKAVEVQIDPNQQAA